MTIQQIVLQLSQGMMHSIAIFGLTLLFSLPLGLLICFGRMSNWAPLRALGYMHAGQPRGLAAALSRFKPIQVLCKFYISIMRGTPLMLQLLAIYYGPYFIFRIKLTLSYQFYAVIIAFSINYAAYFAEIYRSGIQSMPVGQYEAAKVLGYSRSQTFFKIILPQVIKRILPSVTNEVITLVKDTSLAFAIAYAEMFTIAKRIVAKETTMLPFFIAGIYYYIFNFIIAFLMERLEKKLDYYK